MQPRPEAMCQVEAARRARARKRLTAARNSDAWRGPLHARGAEGASRPKRGTLSTTAASAGRHLPVWGLLPRTRQNRTACGRRCTVHMQ
eukprot:8667180-Alexandrium_andersonii.AAC.1